MIGVPNSPTLTPRAERAVLTARSLAWFAGVVAFVALAGWFLHAPALSRYLPYLPPMPPNTAVSLIAAAGALLAISRARWALAAVLVAVPLFIGVATAVEYAMGVTTALDAVFVPASWREGARTVAGRSSPPGMVGLLLVALALAAVRTWPILAQALANVVGLVAIAAITGHIHFVQTSYASWLVSGMAVPTAVALLALAAAIVLVRPDRGIGAALTSDSNAGVLARRLLVPAVLAPVLLGWAVLVGQRAGLYLPQTAAALLVVVTATASAALVLLGVRAIEASDRRRQHAEQGRVEAALREREARALVAAKEDALRARDEFLSIAAHELRTPLAALGMQIQLALRRADTDGTAGAVPRLTAAQRMVGRMGRLVEDLLEISRITSGRLAIELDPEDLDLAALVREVVERFGPAAVRVGSELVVSGVEPCAGRWDRLRLEQVVVQLLSNALKYGAGRPIELMLGADDGVAHLTVRDHGFGIDPAVREQIFQRFERAVSTRHYGGFGLGLWIAREVTEAHGGRIFVESEPGEGASFTLMLPSRPDVKIAERLDAAARAPASDA